MKKLSPSKFKNWYVGSILGLLLTFMIGVISGVILFETQEHLKVLSIILFGVGIASFIMAVIIIKLGRKRMIGIYQEVMDERFDKQLKSEEKLVITWFAKKDDTLLAEGQELYMTKEHLILNNESITWDKIIKLFTKQDEHGWHMALMLDDQREVLLPLYDLIIRLTTHYSRLTLEDQTLQEAQKDYQTFNQSFQVWGFNKTLILLKFLFVFVSLAFGIGVGLMIGLSLGSEDSGIAIGTTLANLIAIPMILIGFPRYFKNTQKYQYMLNQKAIGYASGKKYMVVPFEIIESMSYDDKRLYLNLTHLDEEGHPIIVFIPFDRYLMNRLKNHMDLYSIKKDMIRL
ncbi:MAG: hypothetical protein C4543_09535 [Ignavibacteriales bacterium]|jgi:hypothetical protein|nr:MAG: hypothetical protein C4543_09535 [Ignavibacteriales bacterium]